ncbi:TVP38/TMEM64 family protein [Candidatus Pelagibacter sp. RS40]|uniref:TVP38/TMEM64 family protein n=1 Tax=Candidatus Pelagibacter sp. RS40 TaxID=1977865 RepID=UPI000A16A409|nr:VTT domain-containing protein [Candidatus Pelagibacter sp. RS40]ARJ49172.1 DedA family protein [Candidatus Pelagibacter sp. RS40]
MNKEKKIKIFLGSAYILIVSIFLWFFFSKFSFQDFSSYELIRDNRDTLEQVKNSNIFISSILFLLGTIIWVLLLGFGSPVFLVGGFIFGKWLGTLIIVFGLSIGATFLYMFANYFLKDLIEDKFSSRFNNLTEKFKENEFTFFLIYRFIGGIPFFISNILPTIFNVKIRNFFLGSVIGMTPQLFAGASLGAGLNKILEENSEAPSLLQLLLTPDIYLPIIGIITLVLIGFLLRKKFYSK